jgi:hypothetical protein
VVGPFPERPSLIGRFRGGFQDQSAILIPFDPAVDLEIDGRQQAIRPLSREHLHPFGFGFVVTQGHLLADEGYRGLKEFPVQTDGAVLGDPSPGGLAKEVPQVRRSGSQAFQTSGEPLERGLAGGAVLALMIDFPEPEIEGLI